MIRTCLNSGISDARSCLNGRKSDDKQMKEIRHCSGKERRNCMAIVQP
jgi:hypothetical protein